MSSSANSSGFGEDGAGKDEIAAALGQKPEIDAKPGKDERELADLREADRDEQRGRGRIAEQANDGKGRKRLAEQDDGKRGEHSERILDEDRGLEQHADRDEEDDGEGIAER